MNMDIYEISHMWTVNETNGMMNVIHTVKCIQLK